MNQRVVVIVLVALFATCFVGSGAVATLALVGRVVEGGRSKPEPITSSPEPDEDTAPPAVTPEPDEELATAEPSQDEELLPPDDEEAAEFEPPFFGSGELAVFHVEKSKVDPWGALQKAAKGTRLKVFKGAAPATAEPPYLEFKDLLTDDYAVIAGETLENGRGLTPAVKKALPNAKRVTVVDFVLPRQGASMLEVSKVMAAFAKTTGGVLWDEEAQEYLSQDAWKTRRIDSWEKTVPHVSMNFTVFVSTVEKGVTLKSAGMKHFGLPELQLDNVARSSRDAAVSLLNATAQILAEQHEEIGPGPLQVSLASMRHAQHRKNLEEKRFESAKGVVDVVLAPSGDQKVPRLTITFPGLGAPTELVEAGIAEFFGSADRVDQVNHDEELTALSKAQLEIYKSSIKKRFRKGLQYGEVLLVKAPFETSAGGNEWMWVEVTRLGAGGKIEGLLANDPDDVPELVSGSEVVVEEAELFDWMLQQADGGVMGNETGKVMQKRLAK